MSTVETMTECGESRHGGRCPGVDPNRNWGHHWGGKGASASACSEIYRGPRAFSEPETLAVKNFILNRSRVGGWELYLTFHSYGQMVLYPWGYDRVDHPGESGCQGSWERLHCRQRCKGALSSCRGERRLGA